MGTVEGGQGTAQDALIAYEKGAVLLPLMRTGRASAGGFDYPAHPLTKPPFISQAHWDKMSDSETSVSAGADAIAHVVADAVPFKLLEREEVASTLMQCKEIARACTLVLKDKIEDETFMVKSSHAQVLERAMTRNLQASNAAEANISRGSVAGALRAAAGRSLAAFGNFTSGGSAAGATNAAKAVEDVVLACGLMMHPDPVNAVTVEVESEQLPLERPASIRTCSSFEVSPPASSQREAHRCCGRDRGDSSCSVM